MVLLAFSIFDNKADTFSPPFFKSTRGQAVREFQVLVNDKQSLPSRFPGDFKLVCLGAFEDATGKLAPLDVVESLGFGSDYVEKLS